MSRKDVSQQEIEFRDWQLKKDNEALFNATLRQSKMYTEKLIRIITKYDNLFQDVLDGNKQFVSESALTTELMQCVRILCRILDDNFV